MTTKIRLSSTQVAQISRLTQELIEQTPTGELQRGILYATRTVDRLGREMQTKSLPFETFLMLEKRLLSQLREMRVFSKELRLWEKRSYDQAREFVLAAIGEPNENPATSEPQLKAPKPPKPDGQIDTELTQLTERLQSVASSLESGESPSDEDVINDVLDFAERAGNEAATQLAKQQPPEGSVAVDGVQSQIEAGKELLKSIASSRPLDAQAGPSAGK
ncbi:MAG: hypothetical protein L3J82_06100 [Planctomycetes bacterium]|nr:hypothetical protein [Planctomycetota bacterium]